MNCILLILTVLQLVVHRCLAATQKCTSNLQCTASEYCSSFSERCEECDDICDSKSHNYHENDCNRFCPAYAKDAGINAQVRAIQNQQKLILILVLIILIIAIVSNSIKIIGWLRRKRCLTKLFKSLSSKKKDNAKEQGVGTIANVIHMNEARRPASQIYSVTGMEGSTVLTVTTPVSGRYPGEDSTTTTEDYSYDNAGLQVTPSTTKPPFP